MLDGGVTVGLNTYDRRRRVSNNTAPDGTQTATALDGFTETGATGGLRFKL